MAQTSNSEPRRFWTRHHGRDRTSCGGCGGPIQHTDAALCTACLEWARQGQLSERDALGYED